jgi:thymidylate synthase (FAD)
MNTKLISKTVGQGEFEGKTAEEMIVYCARVSSSRKDKFDKPEGLLNHCIKHGHWSIFEQASMTVEIETSKAIGIQLIRHRSFTFQEFSQRYAVANKFEPVELRKQCEDNRQSSSEVFDPEILEPCFGAYTLISSKVIDQHIDYSKRLYNSLIESGVARECARMILPMCTQTTIMMTGTVRSWIHFLNVRDDQHAQKEIQEVAQSIKQIFIKEFPVISKALGYEKI